MWWLLAGHDPPHRSQLVVVVGIVCEGRQGSKGLAVILRETRGSARIDQTALPAQRTSNICGDGPSSAP